MAGEPSGESTNTIQAVESSFDLIEYLEKNGPLGVAELAEATNIPKSTVHIHLTTLVEAGYVRRDDQQYRLGFRFLEIGGRQRQRRKLFQTAKPEIDKLSRTTGEVANLGVEENGKRVLLYTSEDPEGIFDNAPTGEQTYMHWTSLGKVMLAYATDSHVDAVLNEHGLPRATEHTISTRDGLRNELVETRDRGYSIEDEDHRDGVMAFAKSVEDPDGDVIGAISLSGPRSRFVDNEESLVEEIRNTVNITTLKYEHY